MPVMVPVPELRMEKLTISPVLFTDEWLAETKAKAPVGPAAATVRLAEPLAWVPAALLAVTVHEPVPVPEVETVIDPEVPEPEPEAGAAQDTDAEVAPLVFQLKVEVPPELTEAGLNEALVTDGATTASNEAMPLVWPPGLMAATLQLPTPAVAGVTVIEPEPAPA